MMKQRWIRALLFAVLVAIPIVYLGCGAPAGPPAPPVETPSPVVLKFAEPEDLQIDLNTINVVAPTASVSVKAVVPDDDVRNLILAGPSSIDFINEILITPSFDGLSLIEIPVSETTTTLEADVDFTGAGGFLGEKEQPINVKIDFADFDFDNDGATEGCSGHTAAFPVCVRIWTNGIPYTAWIFESSAREDDPATAEDEKSLGSGRFKLSLLLEALDDPVSLGGVGATMIASFIYAQTDDERSIFVDNAFVATSTDPAGPFGFDIYKIDYRGQSLEQGPAATALKSFTIHQYLDLLDADTLNTGYGETKHLAQFIEGEDYWSGSNFNVGEDTEGHTLVLPFADEQNVCAQISTALAVDLGFCDDLGISVGTTPFIDLLSPAEVAFPTDFPATPTF